MDNVKLSRISLRNVVGIESLDLEPTALTIIEGANAVGKTSILAGIQDMIKGGYDASLIREGQKKAESVLVIGDDEFRKAVGKTARLTRNGKPTDAKKSLDLLIDALAANPIDFIQAKPAEQAKIFMDTFPINLDPAKLKEATGDDHYIAEGGNAFVTLKDIEDTYTSERKAVNRSLKDKQGTISELEKTLPDTTGESAGADLEEARAKKSDLAADIQAGHGRMKTLLDAEAKGIKDELEITVNRLQVEADALIQAEADEAAGKIQAKREEANKQYGQFKRECDEELEKLTGQIGKLGAIAEQVQRAQGTKASIETLVGEVLKLEDESRGFTDKLKGLISVRQELLSGLPKGWTLEDNQFAVESIPFHRLNSEMQLRVVFKIATLRAKDKPVKLICVDGLERLDTKHRENFYKAALDYGKRGYQFIVTRVTDAPGLTVETR